MTTYQNGRFIAELHDEAVYMGDSEDPIKVTVTCDGAEIVSADAKDLGDLIYTLRCIHSLYNPDDEAFPEEDVFSQKPVTDVGSKDKPARDQMIDAIRSMRVRIGSTGQEIREAVQPLGDLATTFRLGEIVDAVLAKKQEIDACGSIANPAGEG